MKDESRQEEKVSKKKKGKKKKKKLKQEPKQEPKRELGQGLEPEVERGLELKEVPVVVVEESKRREQFSPLQDAFIDAWQTAGTAWGLPPAMGAVHAVLLSRDRAWNTDEVMEALSVSRGNAHMQLKALVEWGVAHEVKQLGSRRIGYVAERDVWRIATSVARERQKRELQPILEMQKLLRAHGAASRSMDDRVLKTTLKEVIAFGRLMDKLMSETLRRDERWWERLVRRWINRS